MRPIAAGLVAVVAAGCGRDAAAPPPAPTARADAAVPTRAAPPPIDAGLAEAEVDAGVQLAAASPCPDPHAGLWVGRFYEDDHWNEFRIELVRRGGQLACAQETRWWDAPADALRPPPCPRGGPALGITQLRCEAVLTAAGLEVRTATVLSERHTCDGTTGNYIADWFRGAVTGNTWAATNRFQEPGADWVEQPTTFRRLRCAP